MCLDRLKKFKVSPTHTDGSVKGWKVFEVINSRSLKSRSLHGLNYGGKLSKGWNQADMSLKLVVIRYRKNQYYQSGFHVVVNSRRVRMLAKYPRSRCVPVYFMPEDVTAKGEQFDKDIVVVKRMWIEPHDYTKAVKP